VQPPAVTDDLERAAGVDDGERRPVAAQRPIRDRDADQPKQRFIGGVEQGPDVALDLAGD